MRWFGLESRIVERKYVLPLLKAENNHSPTALVAGMTSNSFPRKKFRLNMLFKMIVLLDSYSAAMDYLIRLQRLDLEG